jgi:hypothetical protein
MREVMAPSVKRYVARLSVEERRELEAMIRLEPQGAGQAFHAADF